MFPHFSVLWYTPWRDLENNALSTKGVGRGPTLAWPGWKQPDISVKVDTAGLKTSRTDTVAAGLSCTELSMWEFEGGCRQGGNSI